MGRKAIGDAAMTAAQRKARSRVLVLGALDGELARVEQLAGEWQRCIEAGRPGVTDADIAQAFGELARIAAVARLVIPRS